jgi:hypothetical protein
MNRIAALLTLACTPITVGQTEKAVDEDASRAAIGTL